MSLSGLTDESKPVRLGPKRATKIRKLFNLGEDEDVKKFVVRRSVTTKGGKEYKKAPKIQPPQGPGSARPRAEVQLGEDIADKADSALASLAASYRIPGPVIEFLKKLVRKLVKKHVRKRLSGEDFVKKHCRTICAAQPAVSTSSEGGKGKAHHTKTPITRRDLDPGATVGVGGRKTGERKKQAVARA